MKIIIQEKEYNLKTEWKEITLLDADKLKRLEVPTTLDAIYKSKDKEEHNELYKALTSKELVKEHPKFFGEVMKVLSDIPSEIVDQVHFEDRTMFYHDYLEQIFLDINFNAPTSYEYQEIAKFKHKGVTYYMPESLRIFEQKIPMYKEKAIGFSEAADITLALEGMEGAGGIAQLCAVLCREKKQDYDEDEAIKRAELFEDLPMNIVWEVFFCILKRLNTSPLKGVFDRLYL